MSHKLRACPRNVLTGETLVTTLAPLSSDSLQQLNIDFNFDFYGFSDERRRDFRSSPLKIYTHTPQKGPPSESQSIPSLPLKRSRGRESVAIPKTHAPSNFSPANHRALVTTLAPLSSDSLQQLNIDFNFDFYGFSYERRRDFRSSPSKIHTHTPQKGPPSESQSIPGTVKGLIYFSFSELDYVLS
ncbi:hypothetical protein F2Q70_00036674 [Brassica cretica]|uniref:Uncharacterized protein n=1 Tax=Brassica cretica TaxID=69181 RepID=A0A8S9JTV9_BRACR|nr:hypothetical protein F2Q70_00036674 [Brassica cretica]